MLFPRPSKGRASFLVVQRPKRRGWSWWPATRTTRSVPSATRRWDLRTDRTFTGQKSDASGLMFYNARYYDPALGTFISPDTIVPNPNLAIDYNRYTYARANPLRLLDPSGNNPACSSLMGPTPANALLAVGCQVAFAIVRAATLYGPQALQVGQQWADKAPAMWDATRTAWDSAWDASNTWLQAQVGNPTQP